MLGKSGNLWKNLRKFLIGKITEVFWKLRKLWKNLRKLENDGKKRKNLEKNFTGKTTEYLGNLKNFGIFWANW